MDPGAATAARLRAAQAARTAQAGEEAAASHLERSGFTVLARNLRVGRDEVDLLALDPDGRTIVVVEVKCRARRCAWPEEQVDRTKRARLSRAALRLSTWPRFARSPFRFDVVSVIGAPGSGAPAALDHWRGAFEATGMGTTS